MTIARECLQALDMLAARVPFPRVKALHLPPAREQPQQPGEFCALELDDGTLGLSFVRLGDTRAQLGQLPSGRDPAGAAALDVARGMLAGAAPERAFERAIAGAAVNALTRWVYDRCGWAPPTDVDSLGALRLDATSHLGMVGHFTPLIPRVLQTGARLTVLELKPELAGQHGGYEVTLDPHRLSACDAILVTGSTLINDTLDGLLAQWRRARHVVLIGPTVGCPPDPLFARGVTALGGTWITDAAAYRDALRAGAKAQGASRKFLIAAALYPGWAALTGAMTA